MIQIRDVPDGVHDALVRVADARGLSLSPYVLSELERLALRAQIAQDNALVVRHTQAAVHGQVSRETIVEILRGGRGD